MEDPKKPLTSLRIDHPAPPQPSPLRKMILVASIAVGVQFGWALQLSLLTPYVQLLGVPHMWSAFIWLCGPISGMLVQPSVGYYSDHCTSRFGRRRPFIAAGAALVSVAVFLIGFSADIGHALGDPADPGATKPRAIAVFAVGFWILDVANNTLQGPCRAFLADLAAGDDCRTRTANSAFSFFMAVGNVLGFAAGSYRHLHRLFPFTATAACDAYCANLKSCFFISVFLLLTLTAIASFFTPEKPITSAPKSDAPPSACVPLPFFGEILGALRNLQKPMWVLMLVTCLNWIAWFPFILFDTDWMGKEVYGGEVGDRSYDLGVQAGALGLMLNSVVLGLTSLAIEPLARVVGGVKRLWGLVNLVLAVCLAMMVVVTKMAEHARHQAVLAGAVVAPPTPPGNVKAGALALFSLLGIPLSITYSIPFALASIFSTNSGAGQGLSLGVLNLAIAVPQMLVSATSGQWDALFGGGNLPAFVAGAVAAATSSVLALTVLPSPPPDVKISGTAGGH